MLPFCSGFICSGDFYRDNEFSKDGWLGHCISEGDKEIREDWQQCLCSHFIADVYAEERSRLHIHSLCTKKGVAAYLQVKDSAFLIVTGDKKSLGFCSYTRIVLFTQLESERLDLIRLTTLGNWFVLPENQNILQSNLFIFKVNCQLQRLTFIFFNNKNKALFSKALWHT